MKTLARKGYMLFINRRVALLLLVVSSTACVVHSKTKFSISDPIPPYTTTYDTNFHVWQKEVMRGHPRNKSSREMFMMNISPFEQKAKIAKNELGTKVELGDIYGKWNILAMLYGNVPTSVASALPSPLVTAAGKYYNDGITLLNSETEFTATKQNDTFGVFTVPLRYRKDGCRCKFAFNVFDDLSITLQTGFAATKVSTGDPISTPASTARTIDGFIDLTGNNTTVPDYSDNIPIVQKELMNKMDEIGKGLGVDFGEYSDTSIEDFSSALYWQHSFNMNKGSREYPPIIFTPYLLVSGTIATAKEKDRTKALCVPAGNDGHHSVGFSLGTNFDFEHTIEVGLEAGYTHFFDRTVSNYRIPNSRRQSGIFPFAADAKVKPGANLHFTGMIYSKHFTDKASVYASYNLVTHQKDSITLVKADSNFFPDELEKKSTWTSQTANLGMSFDLSPNMNVGVLWQAPLTRKSAYKSATILGSLCVVF